MAAVIHVGDLVGILDGTEKGYVVKIDNKKAWIETMDGFEIVSSLDKLVKYIHPPKPIVQAEKMENKKPAKKEEFPVEKKPRFKKVSDKNFKVDPRLIGEEKKPVSQKNKENVWEVDLHVEELTDQYKHLSNGEIVDLQLRHARSILEKARKNRISKVVFIHGKGKGTLKQELLNLLSGYTNLEFYDASFKLYGGGATEVRLYSNHKI